MKYTEEEQIERGKLIDEYSQRTGKNRQDVVIDFELGYLIEKTGSKDSYLVENPDNISENGKFKKQRRKNTHLTPKKKKRK